MSDNARFASPEEKGAETSGQMQEAMKTPPSALPGELMPTGDIHNTNIAVPHNSDQDQDQDQCPAANEFNPEFHIENFWPQATPGSQLAQYENGGIFETTDSPVASISDEVLNHIPSGTSISEEGSILEDSGRTYHGYEPGKYFLPNDPTEQDRLDLQHAMLMILLRGRLFLAPMTEAPKYVLDVATGTGIWALEFAEQNQTSHVVGTDISAIQPTEPPPNVEFIREDSEKEWLYSFKFDYIHLRLTFTCFDDPRKVMQSAFDNLNPGGWIEYQETMFSIGHVGGTIEGTAMQRWCELCNKGIAVARGRDITIAPRLKQWLVETGFEKVEEKTFIGPIGPWAKDPEMQEEGRYSLRNVQEGLRGVGWKMLQAAGLSAPEIEQLISDVKGEVADPANHFYFTFWIVFGRKPLV